MAEPNADYGFMCETCSDSRGRLTEDEAYAYAVRHMDEPFVLKVPHRPYVVRRVPAIQNDRSGVVS